MSTTSGPGVLQVLREGLGTTVQDSGRSGYLHWGLTTGGAIDPTSYRLGQRLLGEAAPLAAIEMTYGNVSLRATTDTTIALTGAPAPVVVEGQPLIWNRTHRLIAQQTITIGRPRSGIYSYLSVAGGINLKAVFGSRSTVLREGLGGYEGRALRQGDQLPIKGICTENRTGGHRVELADGSLGLRFIPGFHYDRLPVPAIDQLLQQTFEVSHERDRVGIRLTGPRAMTGIDRLWSEPTCLGAIQIPPDGHPIILLADRQTVGGYPMIGAVLSVDCARLAQVPAGTSIRFIPVTPDQADKILWLQANYEEERVLECIP